MDFRPLDDTERLRLVTALRGNVEDGRALLTDPRDTSFADLADDLTARDAIGAIRSLPCHY